ncbi:MAG: putative glycosyltransferase [Parcubacteria group bacterium Athens1014_10]|nr:MAG: putative glycosyltransferase [Parcubacteria group bacterium Athens1014_10]TSD04766.1 MAG: putative glycosyltransferase [Parcubacteria group bacterium Athens0714_12]
MPKVAIIILVYNGEKYLLDLLPSLKRQDYPEESCQIILVDNNSQDKSAEYIKNNFPQFVFIPNQKNKGFAKGNNIGIKYALEESFDYLVLLNQDTAVEPNWLGELVKTIEKDEKIGAVQPMILFWDKKDKINSSGNAIHFLGFGFSEDFNQIKNLNQEEREISYASGAAVLFRAKALEEAGLFDENLFYSEDVDLGWRIRLAGYKIINAPRAEVFHKYSFSRNKDKYYFLEYGRIFTLLKNYEIFTLILILPLLVFWEIGMIIYSFLKGWGNLKMKSYKDIFFSFTILIKKRREVQKMRKINDKEICKYIKGKINSNYEDFKNPLFKLINPFLNLYWRLVKFLIHL